VSEPEEWQMKNLDVYPGLEIKMGPGKWIDARLLINTLATMKESTVTVRRKQ
jgi:hypothetical protein